MADHIPEITDHDFADRVLRADRPTLVDFHAVWCAPCRVITPHLEAVARSHAGALDVVKVDVDGNPELAARYDVRNLPTMLLFKGGQVVGQLVGAVPRARIDALVAAAL